MGLGNGNANVGNKGSHHNFEHRLLLAISQISGGTGGDASEATLLLILAELINSVDTNTVIMFDQGNDTLFKSIRTVNQTTGVATHTYEDLTGAAYAPVGAAVSAWQIMYPETRTHNYLNVTAGGTVPTGTIRGSVMNVGTATGIWMGSVLPVGVSVPWGNVANRDLYTALTYDATGTNFVIEYTT